MATTLDGKIAKDSNHFPDWTGKADKKLFVEMTKKAGVLIMGAKTFDTIGKPLPNRKNIILTRDKSRTSKFENLIFTSDKPINILSKLKDEGFSEVILAGGAQINTLFAKENLIDELAITIAPQIFGTGLGVFDPEIEMELKLKSMEKIDENTVFVRYEVLKNCHS
jgi:dihydrofolate reductase